MSENKFTQGPWVLDQWGAVCHSNKQIIVVEGVSLSGRSTEETRANARLIAAAPDLLEALRIAQAQVALLGGTPDPADPYADQMQIAVQSEIRAAIAKALGTGTQATPR